MKNLKFDHQLAMLIREGSKTSTWRIYDDKNLMVNDQVELIDKVDPQNPESWVPIGVAEVDSIVEKRIGDVVPEDFSGHETFASKEIMLEQYQKYYGPQVDLQTPIKMIHFHLRKQQSAGKHSDVENTKVVELKVYADGGSRGNPGPSASGFAVVDMEGNIVVEKGTYIGVTTNNQAEYQALKLGLEEAKRLGAQKIHAYMDSMLVVNQMLGRFKVKNRDLWPIHEAIRQLVAQFKHVSFTHIPRELNKAADRQVNIALDAHAKQGEHHSD